VRKLALSEKKKHPNYPKLTPEDIEGIFDRCKERADKMLKQRWEKAGKYKNIAYTRVSGECSGRNIIYFY
jgi:hypothetical protein